MSLLVLTVALFQSLITNAVDKRPNFILIMTDDQDIVLNSMQAMPNTMKYIANSNNGIAFDNAFIATPICCPSRTETISGRHYHNVMNQGNQYHACMHVSSIYNTINNTKSMFQIFNQNGYQTASFGKLINNQEQIWCPSTTKNNPPLITQGFNRINGACKFGYYQKLWYDLYSNGTSILHNISNPIAENYFTSIIGNASLEWFEEIFINNTKGERQPFIAWIGPHAPHYPSIPSAWYWDKFNDSIAPRTPSWNLQNTGHHGFVSTNPSLNDSNSGDAVMYIDQLYRDRLRTLLSVDDIVYEIFQLLEKYPSEMNNTYVVVTSDHGYDLGQLRIPCSKQEPYETAIKIPMYIYGEKIKNMPKNKPVGNIDLVPTFLDLAGIKYDVDDYDGQSWVKGKDFNRNIYLSQYESVGTYGFSHCNTWFPSSSGNKNPIVPGNCTNPPETNALNETWYVDDEYTNNWRALRMLNESVNAIYIEFYNFTKSGWPDNSTFKSPTFYEFYNISVDPWEVDNIYPTLSKSTQKMLHSLLTEYGTCKGSDCW